MKSNIDNSTTKEKLVQTGLKLFSECGYDATTTRMIAKEAGVTLSSISFHFETKETLYKAVINYAVDMLDQYLNPLFTEINELYDKNLLNLNNAWSYISKLLKMQINWYFNEEYSTVVKLIIREHNFSNGNDEYFYYVLYSKVVALLSQLIMTATGTTDKENAMLFSLSLNGGIQALGEHKAFISKTFEINDPIKYDRFMKNLTEITLNNARVFVENERTLISKESNI
jgi:TetR/AcrR family transcriptional regulator, regulator of cefoperazone and chloramphenicol sensitivity